MQAYVQFLQTPTADTPGTTLLIHLQNNRYLVGNLAEGTQRAAVQIGTRLVKVQNLFLTGRTEWQNIGGLLGMILTLADSANTAYASTMETYETQIAKGKNIPQPPTPQLDLYGAPNLRHTLATCRRYIFRNGMPVNVTEYKGEVPRMSEARDIPPAFKDDFLNVWALSVRPTHPSLSAEAEIALEKKKQQYDEVSNNFADQKPSASETREEREDRYDRIRKSILKHMFDSDWRFDILVEKHLSEVQMPAAIFTRDPETKELHTYSGPMPGGQEPLPDIKVLTRTPWPGALVQHLPPTTPAPEAISYIFRTHSVRGKFDAKRAAELKVKRGPDMSALTKGQSVQSEDGQTITPDMVMGAERPGQGVAVLDIPSKHYIEPLLNREEFSAPSVVEGLKLFVWILGPGLSGHPTLKQFMKRFNEAQHVVSSPDTCPNKVALSSVASQTVRLSQIDPERYSVPFHDNTTLPQNSFCGRDSKKEVDFPGAMAADVGLKFKIMPEYKILEDGVVPLWNGSAVEQETANEIIEAAKAARDAVEKDRKALEEWRQKLPRPDTEVITLGTGSALPSKYRNVSATLVCVPGVGNYLFDCGENTLGQLQRVFPPAEFEDVIRNLRMIWISHLHADHHLGTAAVIKAWYKIRHNSIPADNPPMLASPEACNVAHGLSVVSDEGMLKWLFEYSSVEDFGYSRILPLEVSTAAPKSASGTTLRLCPLPAKDGEHRLVRNDYEQVLGVSDIQACYVQHCRGARAVSITFPDDPNSGTLGQKCNPLKVSYSGDCRPSVNFTHIGRDSTVLIHEATFDDELRGDAVAKKHSTTSEALGIGAKMNAKAVVLTHFSQRYQKIPVLETVVDNEEWNGAEEDAADVQKDAEMDDADPTDQLDTKFTHVNQGPAQGKSDECGNETVIKVHSKDMKVAIAFDYMRVKIGEVAQLEKFTPALSKLFAVEGDEEGRDDDAGRRNENGKMTSSDDAEGENMKKRQRQRSKRNN